MAAMCSPMTKPTASRSWSWARMCTGVIVMMATMTTWAVTMTPAPTQARGPGRGGASAVVDSAAPGSVSPVSAASRRPSREGSGRSSSQSTAPAVR